MVPLIDKSIVFECKIAALFLYASSFVTLLVVGVIIIPASEMLLPFIK